MPDESTLRNFLGLIVDQEALDKLAQVNQELLSLKAKTDKPLDVWLDIDDSVITVLGNKKELKTVTILAITDGLPTKSRLLSSLELVNWSTPNCTVEMWPAMGNSWSFSKKLWTF